MSNQNNSKAGLGAHAHARQLCTGSNEGDTSK
jgi:hypothetical protein